MLARVVVPVISYFQISQELLHNNDTNTKQIQNCNVFKLAFSQ